MWTTTTISDMLKKEVYIGKNCWHKRSRNLTTGKKAVKNGRVDWIVTEYAHETIVSKELFQEANDKAFAGKRKLQRM